MYETIPTERLRRHEAAVHDLALDCMVCPGREADANLLSREAKAMRDELDRRGSIVPPNYCSAAKNDIATPPNPTPKPHHNAE